jgi:hypothetical protein
VRSFPLIMLLTLSGCAIYIPHPPADPPPPGTDIRARLTDPGAVRVTGLFGLPIRELEGRILELSPDSLRFALLSAQEYKLPWNQEQELSLAWSEVVTLEEKRIDRRRTALFVAGAGTLTGVLIAALFRAATRNEGQEELPPDMAVIPIFSIIH